MPDKRHARRRELRLQGLHEPCLSLPRDDEPFERIRVAREGLQQPPDAFLRADSSDEAECQRSFSTLPVPAPSRAYRVENHLGRSAVPEKTSAPVAIQDVLADPDHRLDRLAGPAPVRGKRE